MRIDLRRTKTFWSVNVRVHIWEQGLEEGTELRLLVYFCVIADLTNYDYVGSF